MFLHSLIISLFTLIFVVIAHFAIKKISAFFYLKYEKKKRSILSSLMTALVLPLQVFIWIDAAFYLTEIFLNDFQLTLPFWNKITYSKLLFFICLSGFFYLWKKNYIKDYKKERKRNDPNLHYVDAIDKLSSLFIFFLLLMFALDQMGQNIATLLTIGGIGAAAIGFAAKELISNCFGGFLIYLNSPFYIGDTIQISGKEIKGEVEEIGWCVTKIRDEEKQSLFVPNALFFQFIIINLSRKTHKRFKEIIYIEIKNDLQVIEITETLQKLLLNYEEIDLTEKYEILSFYLNENLLKVSISFYSKELKSLEFESFRQKLLIEIRKLIHSMGLTITSELIPLKIQNIE